MGDGLLHRFIKQARGEAAKHFGPHGDEVDAATVIFLDLFLWCVLFYSTDRVFGTSNKYRHEKRGELMLRSVKELVKRIQRRSPTNDELRGWSHVAGLFMGGFERHVSSSGGLHALCRPIFSNCVRPVVSERAFSTMMPSAAHARAFDIAAAYGAVFVMNTGKKNGPFSVIDETAVGSDWIDPDVFLSYSSRDRTIALTFADALNTMRIPTWIDRELSPGDEFSSKIDARLGACKIVLALWSPYSVASLFVRAEALHGFTTKRLVSIMIAPCDLPVPFNAVQAIKWPESEAARQANWPTLLELIGDKTGRPGLSAYFAAKDDPALLAEWNRAYPDDPLARD